MPGRFREVPLIQSTWFMRARSFIGFIEQKAEDLDYCLRHAELGGIFAKVEGGALVTYRHCAGSLRHATWAEMRARLCLPPRCCFVREKDAQRQHRVAHGVRTLQLVHTCFVDLGHASRSDPTAAAQL